MKKSVKLFGKMMPVWLILTLVASVPVSAALLTMYGQIVTTAIVQQSILLDGKNCDADYNQCIISSVIPEGAPGGEEFCFKHTLENQMSVEGTVNLETTILPDGVGITTGIYSIPETTTLELTSKDSGWKATIDMKATLTFKTSNPKFEGTLTTTGLENEQYALIYYPDQEDRFDPTKWNGNGGVVIATFTDDQTDLVIDAELDTNLPLTTDWNVNPDPDYCDNHNSFDDYAHCRGAKIWIVPTSDLTGTNSLPLTVWNPTTYLFETDLVMYFDCDLQTESEISRVASLYKGVLSTPLTIPSKTTENFLVCYAFEQNIAPRTYTITTTVV